MLETYLTHLQFANALISLIVLIELSINFRKPITLKILFIIFLSSIFLHNISLLFNFPVFIREYTRIIIALSGIQIIQYLYNFKINKKQIAISLACFVLLFINLITLKYFDPKNHNILFWSWNFCKIIITISIFYLFAYTYLKMLKSLDDKNIYSIKIKNWVKFTIFLISISILNNLASFLFSPNLIYIKLITSLILLTSCFLVNYRPSFINRTDLTISLSGVFRKTIQDQIKVDEFTNEFYTKTYFLNKNISIEELALILNLPTSVLKNYIYETTKMNFIDLVNKCRVDYYVKLVATGNYNAYSIESLAQMSGFGSRQSLHTNFKRFHGGSPSDLIKMVN